MERWNTLAPRCCTYLVKITICHIYNIYTYYCHLICSDMLLWWSCGRIQGGKRLKAALSSCLRNPSSCCHLWLSRSPQTPRPPHIDFYSPAALIRTPRWHSGLNPETRWSRDYHLYGRSGEVAAEHPTWQPCSLHISRGLEGDMSVRGELYIHGKLPTVWLFVQTCKKRFGCYAPHLTPSVIIQCWHDDTRVKRGISVRSAQGTCGSEGSDIRRRDRRHCPPSSEADWLKPDPFSWVMRGKTRYSPQGDTLRQSQSLHTNFVKIVFSWRKSLWSTHGQTS